MNKKILATEESIFEDHEEKEIDFWHWYNFYLVINKQYMWILFLYLIILFLVLEPMSCINKLEQRQYSEKEMIEITNLYKMLLKMKKRRPDLDANKLIDDLYPNNGITKEE